MGDAGQGSLAASCLGQCERDATRSFAADDNSEARKDVPRGPVPSDILSSLGWSERRPRRPLSLLTLNGVNHGPEVFEGRVQLHVMGGGEDQAPIVAYVFDAA